MSITLEQDDSPNRIFESLNNTGRRLSVSDLIRNYLFMHIPGESQQQVVYDKYWFPMQQRLKDENENQDYLSDFFWRYLMMNGQLPRQDETFEGVRELLGQPSTQEATEALKRFFRYSVHYARLANLNQGESKGLFLAQMSRLNQWEVDVAYPFLMKAMEHHSEGSISEVQLVEVMRLVESFVVRRTVCGVPTNRLRRVFAMMSSRVDYSNIISSARSYLLENEWPGDQEFREAFIRFRLYVPSRLGRTRLVLRTLEESFGHKERPEITDKITIEHVMPQTLTPNWKEVLGPNFLEVHAQWLDTVGNLTLSGYNPDLGNQPFSEKRRLLTNSNFALSKMLQEHQVWNQETVLDRAGKLANRALTIWVR